MSTGHYAYIPEPTLLSEAFRQLKPHARLLYVYMVCKRAGKPGGFRYPYKEIRRDTRFKFNTIASSVRQLARGGFLTYQHGGLQLNSNIYFLEASWLER